MSNPNINVAGTLTSSSVNTTNLLAEDAIIDNITIQNINGITNQTLQTLDTTSSISQSLSSLTGAVSLNTFDISNNKISLTSLANNKLNKNNDVLSNATLINCVDVSGSLIASRNFVDLKIAELVDSSPQTMDTLREISNSLNTDPSFNSTMITQLGLKVNTTDLQANYHNKSFIDASQNSIQTSIGSINTTIANNYYNKTQVDASFNAVNSTLANNYYNKTQIDASFNAVNSTVSATNTNVTNVTNRLNNIDTGVTVQANSVTSNKNFGINTLNPVNALHCIGDATINGSLNVTQNINTTTGTINAGTFTINSLVNVGDTLNNNNQLINTNANNITTNTNNIEQLLTFNRTYPRFGFSGSTPNTSNYSGGRFTPTTPLKIEFLRKTSGLGTFSFSNPITFSLKAFFYGTSNSIVNQTTMDLMLLPVSMQTFGNTGITYNFNNDIDGAGSFGLANRPYWTYNQVFTSNAVPKGVVTCIYDSVNNFQRCTFNFIYLFNDATRFSISCEALDISGASDWNCTIGT